MFMFNIPETTTRRKILEKHQQMKKKGYNPRMKLIKTSTVYAES